MGIQVRNFPQFPEKFPRNFSQLDLTPPPPTPQPPQPLTSAWNRATGDQEHCPWFWCICSAAFPFPQGPCLPFGVDGLMSFGIGDQCLASAVRLHRRHAAPCSAAGLPHAVVARRSGTGPSGARCVLATDPDPPGHSLPRPLCSAERRPAPPCGPCAARTPATLCRCHATYDTASSCRFLGWGGAAQPPIRQLLGAADAQTAHPATSSTAPTHQLLGSANAETTPAGAPAAAADRTQRPDATCEGTNG